MGKFDGKVAIITGGAKGMGYVACNKFSAEGAKIVCVDFDGEAAKKTVAEVNEKGGDAIAVVADLTKAEDRDRIFEETMAKYGRVDILINNAGWGCKLAFLDTDEASFDRSVNLNMKANYFMIQQAAKHMIEQGTGGKIVTTSSTAGLAGEKNASIYGGTKAAIMTFSKAIALELGQYGINVNVVAPGFTRTNNNSHIPGVIDETFMEITPTKRINVAEDIVNTILFLCTEEARQIDGQVISVDGGYSTTRYLAVSQDKSMQVK